MNRESSESQVRKRRIVYNDDGGSIIYSPHQFPMSLDQYYDCVDHLLGTHVDTYVLCVGSTTHIEEGGTVCQTIPQPPFSRMIDRRVAENWKHLASLGVDPETALLNRAKDQGLEAIASLRMNDAHFAYSTEGPETSGRGSRFWLEHPECRIDPSVDTKRVLRGTSEWWKILYNYEHPLVRKLVFDAMDEIFRKCDADGFEMDFMRHPYYWKPEDVGAKLDVMTEFVRGVRSHLDQIGRCKGRQLRLGALVPMTPEEGKEIGLDCLTWIHEGLLDYIVPKHYIEFIMDAPLDGYIEAAKDAKTDVYSCLENWPAGSPVPPIEDFRGAAARYWAAGVDAIYLYNYFNHRDHPHTEEDRMILQEIGNPRMIERKDKRLALRKADPNQKRESRDFQLPLPIAGSHRLTFLVPDDVVRAAEEWSLSSVVLRLCFDGLSPEQDDIRLRLNSIELSPDSFSYPFDPAGYRFAWIELDLAGGLLPRRGSNELTIELKERCSDVVEPLVLIGVEVLTRYR